MEPISLAASLIAVGGLVTASSKKIHDLRRKLSKAPKDVESLVKQVQTFESLLTELNTQLQDHRNSATPQETLQQVWGSSIAQMQRDVQNLQNVLSELESLLQKRSRTSKILLLARQILSEKEVEWYRRMIDTHCGTLTSIQAMICSRKLGKVSESIIQLRDEDRAAFRSISSQLSQTASRFDSEAKAGFSTVSSQHTASESANEARHLTVLAHLDEHTKRHEVNSEKMDEVFQQQVRSMDMNEAGLQAVHCSLVTASSSSSEDHKATHAMLSHCQGQLQQILRNNVTFGTVESGVPLSRPRARASDNSTGITVYWKYYSYRMPIGMLRIRLRKSQQSQSSSGLTRQVYAESKVVLDFVPPRWLSRIAINYSMKLNYDLISDQWHWGATLKPLTVNYNPFFIKAVKTLDGDNVRRSFAEGLAQPTDCILDIGGPPRPWYEFAGFSYTISCDTLTKYGLMLDIIMKYGLPGGEHLISNVFFGHRAQGLDARDLRNYVHHYTRHGGKILTAESRAFDILFIAYKVSDIDWILDLLFNAPEPWLVDELSSLQICLIGTLARADALFSNRLKKKMASYHSPASSYRTPSADDLFEITFSANCIKSRFRTLQSGEMYDLLSLLCRTGSISMVKPFIDIGVDVNGGGAVSNLLGEAAAVGNVDIVYMLLEAGANGSLAIKTFLFQRKHLSEAVFGRLLDLLIENAKHASFEYFNDPLLAVLQSSTAIRSCPKAPKILLDRKCYTTEGFGEGAKKTHYSDSYMYEAISTENASVVDLLLQNGARADTLISHSFDCLGAWFKSCTWLTFAVIRGAAACADVLIRYGADVTALDGAGRSAIQLARNYELDLHPRIIKSEWGISVIADEDEDAETLAVVERAFHLKFQGTKSMEEFLESGDEIAPQPPSRLDKVVLVLQRTFEKALGTFLTPIQTELLLNHIKHLHRDTRKIWSLPFHEALLMRSMYVLSYAIVLAYELQAFIRGHKCIPMPSRFILSALAFLALVLIWGSASQGGVSWGLSTAETKP